MKTTFALLLLSISSSSVFSIDNNAEDLNYNLQNSAHVEVLAEATPRQRCYRRCNRSRWQRNCRAKCDRRSPAPTPAPVEPAQPQCYNIGDPCKVDSDCLTGGFNPCNKCGTSHGTQYYKRCYSEPVTFEPTPAPTEVGMCGQSCWNNADCKSQYAGTWNPCMVCSRNHGAKAGTRYMCIDTSTYEKTSGGDVCDGVATSRKQDCKDYCQSGPGSNHRRYRYRWSYDSDEYKCTCNNGRVCVTPRYEENGKDEVKVSEDYFDSNSADFFQEE